MSNEFFSSDTKLGGLGRSCLVVHCQRTRETLVYGRSELFIRQFPSCFVKNIGPISLPVGVMIGETIKNAGRTGMLNYP